MSDPLQTKSKISNLIIIVAANFTLLVLLIIIFAALYQLIFVGTLDKDLKSWTDVALGFLFGNLAQMVANYIKQ